MNGDFYRMMTAKNVICGFSTFCHSATLSNIDAETIIWPDKFFNDFDFMPHGIVLERNVWLSAAQKQKRNMTVQDLGRYLIEN